jgi:DNA-binding NtrC family response regulator
VLRPSFGGNDPFGEALTAAAPPLAAKAGGEQIPRRGTLFLNEIALLDRALQVRLMERIEEGPLLRTGPLDGQGLELRVICVTSRQLQGEVATGTFLRELFYMVRVVTLELPPLRQRRGDIPELARYFLDHYNREFRTTTPPPPPRIMDRMRGYDWPGNIRELENLIMRHALQGSEDAFAGELGSRNPSSSAGISSTDMIPLKKAARDAAHEWERKVILKVLEEHHWNRREAARALNISYTALLYKIKNAGIPPQRNKQGECHPRP